MSDMQNAAPRPAAYCRTCGKGLYEPLPRAVNGTIYCEEHLPMTTQNPAAAEPPSPYTSPYVAPAGPQVNSGVSPGLAFVLGLIPGVGAIYNGQYAKGLIHVVILGVLISVMETGAASGLEPLVGMMIGTFVFYMAFEAYHTAKKRQMGLAVDEFSSLMPSRGASRFPAAPILVIALGVVMLANNLGLFEVREMLRYGLPLFLIALGAYLLYVRLNPTPSSGEVINEQR